MGSYPTPPSANDPRYTPEILPPEQGYGYVPQPQPEQPRARRSGLSWASAPATYLLVAINCAVYLLMTLTGSSPLEPSTEQLLHWGADHAGLVLIAGEWWRIVTAMFVHVGIFHIGVNMWCLWNLGLLAEPLMGFWGLIAVYLLTGAAGNLLSVAHSYIFPIYDSGHPVYAVGAGASGAIFGIAGALIILLKSQRLPVPQFELKKLRKSVIYFAAINLVFPFLVNFGANVMHAGLQIDISAHVGGLACGLLFAAPMLPRLGVPRNQFTLRLRTAIGMVTGVLVLFAYFLAQVPPR
jgi:rhomboid protease GluP